MVFHQIKPAVCAVYLLEDMTLDEHELGPSFDNTHPSNGFLTCDHKADFLQLVIRAGNCPQNRKKTYGFPVLADAVRATVVQALAEIEAAQLSPQTFKQRAAENFRRITAETGWKDKVSKRVFGHCRNDQEAKRYTDLTEAGYVRCLEKQGARCPVSWILFGEREWSPSMDRIYDLLGHIIAEPSNVAFIIRMFNTQIKMTRKLFLQVLLKQKVQQPTPLQRSLILDELEALTEPSAHS